MAEESFKERARQEMIKAAKQYKDIYVDYEYLICSVTFEKNAESLYLCGFPAFQGDFLALAQLLILYFVFSP